MRKTPPDRSSEKSAEKQAPEISAPTGLTQFLKSTGKESEMAAEWAAMYRTIKEVLILKLPELLKETGEEN